MSTVTEQARATLRADEARAQRASRARAWVLTETPELVDDHGQPCPFAVAAALELTRRGTPPTAAGVRDTRRLNLERLGLEDYA